MAEAFAAGHSLRESHSISRGCMFGAFEQPPDRRSSARGWEMLTFPSGAKLAQRLAPGSYW
jgi:hypothetical protein